MKGLEVSVLRKSDVLADNDVTRFDSTYFLRRDQSLIAELRSADWERLSRTCDVTDGIHTSIDFEDGTGIRVISAKHPKEGFFDLSSGEEISAVAHQLNPRTALRVGDVIISTVGTIGNVAVVTPDLIPANSDRHVGIIRPRANANHPISSEYLSCFLLSRFGRMQSRRETTGNVQPNLFLDKIRSFMVARLDTETERAITAAYHAAKAKKDESESKIADAETILLAALGLAGWRPLEPLSYTARAADALSAARLDAQYFAPRIREMLDLLGRDGRRLSDIAKPRRDRFNAKKCDSFHYIEISDVERGGGLGASPLDSADAPSRATWHVRGGDVLTSTVRPIRRLSAIVAPDQDRYVASSGFAVLQPTDVTAEVLMTFLRLPAICELMDLYASASMYPAISEANIMGLPVPMIPIEVADAVTATVQSAFAARASARALLNAAKRAVEIAIEESEAAALAFLEA